jgi:hypothetical protein
MQQNIIGIESRKGQLPQFSDIKFLLFYLKGIPVGCLAPLHIMRAKTTSLVFIRALGMDLQLKYGSGEIPRICYVLS